jgi:hypothetical protein
MKKYKMIPARHSEVYSWWKSGNEVDVSKEIIKKIATDNYIYFKDFIFPFVNSTEVHAKSYQLFFRQRGNEIMINVISKTARKDFLVKVA